MIDDIVFDENLKQGEDVNFIYQLLHFFNTYSSNDLQPKIVYRIHDNNTTLQTTETIFYRRALYRKLLIFALKNYISFQVIWHNFITYIEYDFLWVTRGKFRFKKIFKILFMPILIYRFIFKNDIHYDKVRTIHRT